MSESKGFVSFPESLLRRIARERLGKTSLVGLVFRQATSERLLKYLRGVDFRHNENAQATLAYRAMSVDEVRERQAKLSGWSVVGWDDAGPAFLDRTQDDRALDPCEETASREMTGRLMDNIDRLPERMRQVLSLYYCDDLNLREIGQVMGVTESRVCQIHGEATRRLRKLLGEDYAA